MKGVLNLEDQLSFYMAYHSNKVNILIHSICVPLITFSSFFLLANFKSPLPVFQSSLDAYANLGVLSSAGLAILYILLDPYVGTAVAPIVIGSSMLFTDILENDSYIAKANSVAGVIFVISWIAQFIGHGVFEHRAPALLDNLVQALILAPFFVTYEAVFVLGFRKDLQKRLEVKVADKIKKFKEAKQAKTPVKEKK
ncbi:uncharacterized protein V2V93DRAFT_366447 [Kockiozyma suomiensis]|uniref:uncharacterized protein n=1 Tax=Kockiozyma suomiensis TaxID=1337062 RepID=UPI0033434E18